MKRIVCYSGGHSSALVAIEVVRRFGKDDVILLNHNIHSRSEDSDIKRFKTEVSDALEVPITYANHPEWDTKDQFDVVVEAKAFKVGSGTALCSNRLKTEPFRRWLSENFPVTDGVVRGDVVIYYGFDKSEPHRITRRSQILSAMGYQSDFPLALWTERTIESTTEIGISPPLSYSVFKHANCTGCLKAGAQHWYAVFCLRPDIWERGKYAEKEIGYSINNESFLEELEPKFKTMQRAGVEPTEKMHANTFWSRVRKVIADFEQPSPTLPCECTE